MFPTASFTIWRGNSGVVENAQGISIIVKSGTPPVPVNLTGSVITFLAVLASTKAEIVAKTSANGGVIVTPEAGAIVVPITEPESLLFLMGERDIYEIERQIGADQRTLVWGYITATGGTNG